MNKGLVQYVENEIFPLYSRNEEGHGVKHIKTVIKRSLEDEQWNIIKQAIEDHRSSSSREPRTIYGKIISTADRTIIDIDNTIRISYSYGKRYYIGLSYEEQVERVFQHLTEKYGENGYAKVYLEDKEFEEALYKLRQALSNKDEFITRVKKVTKEM